MLWFCVTTNCIDGLNCHLQLTEKRQENKEDDLDRRALEEGFVSDNLCVFVPTLCLFLGMKHCSILLC